MSHPAASVKSIFSGKVNFDSMDDFDQSSNLEFNSDVEDSSSRFSGDSGNSITSKNLRNLSETLGNQRAVKVINNSYSNVSNGSSESEYQHTSLEGGIDQSGLDLLQPDPFSRPISRNSTTSCLSTTATKDGIEGKRFHRYGPTPYSSNIISNMMHQQAERPNELPVPGMTSPNLSNSNPGAERPVSPSGFFELSRPIKASPKTSSPYSKSALLLTPVESSTLDSIARDKNYSEVSIKSTFAEFDGESGLEDEKRKTFVENSLPAGLSEPPTLREKMDLLATEAVQTNRD
jgi:hypothetical protein